VKEKQELKDSLSQWLHRTKYQCSQSASRYVSLFTNNINIILHYLPY